LRLIGEPRWRNDGFFNSAGPSEIPAEEPIASPYWRRRKVGLLLCALLLVVGAATSGVLLQARTGGSTDAAPINIEGRGRTVSVRPATDKLRPTVTIAVKSSALMPSLPSLPPAPPNEQPVEAQGPTTPAASETPARSPQCNIHVCQRFYRSFHRSDCTYQPFSGGPRQICDR
jgi:hypothetical protein